MSRDGKRGFTLVELIIVIIILGILALLAVPMFQSSSEEANQKTYETNLAALRGTVQRYHVEHSDTWPGEASAGGSFGAAGSSDAFKNQLEKRTNAAGAVSASVDAAYPRGPYFMSGIPANPTATNVAANLQTVVGIVDDPSTLSVTDAANCGWIFNIQSGELIGNTD